MNKKKILEETIIMNEKTIKVLKNENELLEGHVNDQEKRILLLEKDIEELKNRDEPITVREGFVSLEKYIMMEILKSKKEARKIGGVINLFNSKQYETECNNFLSCNNITIDHIFLIADIKEHKNKSAHERPTTTRNDFENFALSLLIDDDDKNMAKDLLKYLELKNPHDSVTGLWNITKPY
jgi:hypothetical protein